MGGGSLPTLKESEVAVGKFPLVAKVTAASRTDAADVERPRPWDDAAAFVPDRSLYEPMTKGQSATDWLQNTHEEPQTFDDFREMTDTQSLSAARTAPLSVRILPIGDMTRHFATPPPDDELRTLRSFLDMFFCGRLEALVLPAADVREDLQTRSVRSSPARQAKRPKLKVEVATPPPQTPNIDAAPWLLLAWAPQGEDSPPCFACFGCQQASPAQREFLARGALQDQGVEPIPRGTQCQHNNARHHPRGLVL